MSARRLAAVGVLALSIALTGAARADNLLEIYRRARQNDPAFEAARHALDAAAQKLPQARSGLLPSISLSGNTGRQKGEASFGGTGDVTRSVRSHGLTLQLNQPLLRVGNWIAHDQADAQVRQAEEQFRQEQQELILRVAQAYFDLVVAQESIAVADAQLKAVEEQLGLAKRNFDVGIATVTDVHEARSRFDLARAQRIAAANDLESKHAELERIVGDMPRSLPPLSKDAALPTPDPADVGAWIEKARERHPLVRIRAAADEVAEIEVAKNRSGHLPTLDLTVSYGDNFSSGSMSSPADMSTGTRAGQVGLQLTIPIYSGGGTDARVQEAVSNRYKAKADLDAARRQAASLARQAFAGAGNGHAQIEALASAVESSKSAVDANKVGYRIGTRINIDVLNAEQQLFAARRDLSKARAETLLHLLRLKAATGSLEEADLAAVNALLER